MFLDMMKIRKIEAAKIEINCSLLIDSKKERLQTSIHL